MRVYINNGVDLNINDLKLIVTVIPIVISILAKRYAY